MTCFPDRPSLAAICVVLLTEQRSFGVARVDFWKIRPPPFPTALNPPTAASQVTEPPIKFFLRISYCSGGTEMSNLVVSSLCAVSIARVAQQHSIATGMTATYQTAAHATAVDHSCPCCVN